MPTRVPPALAAIALALSVGPAQAKPVALFDGKTFAGWDGDTKETWSIKDGCIVGGSLTRKIPRNQFLATRASFKDFVLRLNLRSAFLCTRAATPHMIRQRYGKIVCLSSGAREGTPWTAYYAGGSAYSASKAGVHGFIRDVALELAQYGINVNAVAPGPIDTERTGANLKELDRTVEFSPSKMTPLGRLGLPVEVANAVLFLASDEASYITGHTLPVTGGR